MTRSNSVKAYFIWISFSGYNLGRSLSPNGFDGGGLLCFLGNFCCSTSHFFSHCGKWIVILIWMVNKNDCKLFKGIVIKEIQFTLQFQIPFHICNTSLAFLLFFIPQWNPFMSTLESATTKWSDFFDFEARIEWIHLRLANYWIFYSSKKLKMER